MKPDAILPAAFVPSQADEHQLWQQRWLWILLGLGLAARAVRYLLCFPLWDDEAFLCVNLIGASYAELLGPLDYHQVAPVGFLFIELTTVKLLGFWEWSLRLFPFLCGLGSMVLFFWFSGRVLSGWPRVLAVAVFAVSYPAIRHAAEAKQYASDLLVGLAQISLFVHWYQTQQRWSLMGLLALVPLGLVISYPAVFVAGGVSLSWAFALWEPRLRRSWPWWLVFNALLGGSFAGVMWLAQAQSQAELEWMVQYWHYALPPRQWKEFFRWVAWTHVGDLMAIPVGSGRGGSALSFVFWALGLGVLLWRRQGVLALLATGPLAAHFVAALMHRYPYGGHVKFTQYIAPMICVTMGVGIWAAAAGPRWIRRRLLNLQLAVGVLAMIAVGCMARDFCFPYKTRTDRRHRDFARWFWHTAQFQGPVVCAISDLGNPFIPDRTESLNWTAMYLCNQAIYSPRHHRGEEPAWDEVSEQQPLRIVIFRPGTTQFRHELYRHWRSQLQVKFRIVAWEQFAFPCYGKREKKLSNVDHVEVITVVPRARYQHESPRIPDPVALLHQLPVRR